MRTVDEETSKFLDMVVDCFREAVPLECASHPCFATVLKFDQTLYRQVNTRAARREAFLASVFPGWVMSAVTHPVDAVRAERASRCLVAMRLGIYNDLRRASAAAASAPVGARPPSAPIASTRSFYKAVEKLRNIARRGDDGLVKYDCDLFRHGSAYAQVNGWMKLLQEFHEHNLIEEVEASNGDMVPVQQGLQDGCFTTVLRGNRRTAPTIKLHVERASEFAKRG